MMTVCLSDLFRAQQGSARHFSPEIIIGKQFIIHQTKDAVRLHNCTFKLLVLFWRPGRWRQRWKTLTSLSKQLWYPSSMMFMSPCTCCTHVGSCLVLQESSRIQLLWDIDCSRLPQRSPPVLPGSWDRGSAGYKWPVLMPGGYSERHNGDVEIFTING